MVRETNTLKMDAHIHVQLPPHHSSLMVNGRNVGMVDAVSTVTLNGVLKIVMLDETVEGVEKWVGKG
jgi:hypothetical protein